MDVVQLGAGEEADWDPECCVCVCNWDADGNNKL